MSILEASVPVSARRKRTLRERLRILLHNFRYFTHRLLSYDHEEACRYLLKLGGKIANPVPSYWDKCPVCEHELERTVQQGFIIPFCPRWHLHPCDTSELVTHDGERQSDKLAVPLPLGARQRNRSLQETQELPTPKQ